MNDHDDELTRRLERLAAITPSSGASARALDRVRTALVNCPPVRRPAMPIRWAAIAATVLLAVGLAAWLLPPLSSGVAWADVQTAINSAHTITFRMTARSEGRPEASERLMILGNGLCRFENGDGSYTIADFTKSRQMRVDPKKRTADVLHGVNNMPIVNPYEFIKNLPGDATARPLPGKKIDGREVLGFVVKVRGNELTVWADAKTRLPVRIQMEEGGEGKKVEVVMDEFVFDKKLDTALFAFEPPAGYKVTTTGLAELPAAPTDVDLLKPVVTPLVGIGPVKFGTSIAEVQKLFGKPDAVQEHGKNGYTEINYGSRGIFLGAGKTAGLVMISCGAQAAWATKIRDFAGQTDKGIAIGASLADVLRAYGPPDSKETNQGSMYLNYNRLQCNFTLFDDKLVQMNFSRPRPAK